MPIIRTVRIDRQESHRAWETYMKHGGATLIKGTNASFKPHRKVKAKKTKWDAFEAPWSEPTAHVPKAKSKTKAKAKVTAKAKVKAKAATKRTAVVTKQRRLRRAAVAGEDPLTVMHAYEHLDIEQPDMPPYLAAQLAPKLSAIAKSVVEVKLKTIVFLHERHGLQTLVSLLQHYGVSVALLRPEQADGQALAKNRGKKGTPDAVANAVAIGRFNAPNNDLGDELRVLVGDPRFVGEGVSLRSVRRVIFGTVPDSYPEFMQTSSRALRACSHRRLVSNMRNLRIEMFVTVHMRTDRQPTIDVQRLQRMLDDIPFGAVAPRHWACWMPSSQTTGLPPFPSQKQHGRRVLSGVEIPMTDQKKTSASEADCGCRSRCFFAWSCRTLPPLCQADAWPFIFFGKRPPAAFTGRTVRAAGCEHRRRLARHEVPLGFNRSSAGHATLTGGSHART